MFGASGNILSAWGDSSNACSCVLLCFNKFSLCLWGHATTLWSRWEMSDNIVIKSLLMFCYRFVKNWTSEKNDRLV